MDTLFLYIDLPVFTFINVAIKNMLFDSIFPVITYGGSYYHVMAAGLLSVLLVKKGKLDYAFSFLLSLFLARLASHELKLIFARPRPAASFDWVNTLGPELYGYSFPSGHSTIAFAMGIFLAMKFPKLKPYFITLAVLVAFSRIYMGVHYPSDVIAGAILGGAVSFLCVKGADRLMMLRKDTSDCQ